MISAFFFVLGAFIGWRIRSTKAGVWISKQFSTFTGE